jgi:hypothetical protein
MTNPDDNSRRPRRRVRRSLPAFPGELYPGPSTPEAFTQPTSVSTQPSPAEALQTVQLEGRLTARATGRGALSLETGATTKEGMAARARRTFERQVPRNIGDARNATLAFAKAINGELEQLKRSKPNEEQQLKRHEEFVSFLEMLSKGLTNLAKALDEAVKAAGRKNEGAFLGKAGDIVEQLSTGVMEWVTKNRAHVAGYTIRMGFWGRVGTFCTCAGWTELLLRS